MTRVAKEDAGAQAVRPVREAEVAVPGPTGFVGKKVATFQGTEALFSDAGGRWLTVW